jgi:hypothetical protein
MVSIHVLVYIKSKRSVSLFLSDTMFLSEFTYWTFFEIFTSRIFSRRLYRWDLSGIAA